MLLHTNVVLSSCAAVATDQHGTVTEGGCLRVNKKGAGGLAGGLKFSGLVVQWFSGSVVQCMVQWFSSSMVQWFNGVV